MADARKPNQDQPVERRRARQARIQQLPADEPEIEESSVPSRPAPEPDTGVTARQLLSQWRDPCAVPDVPLELTTFTPPSDLADPRRVTAAGALLLVHHYGTRMRFFDAIDRAREWLDEDKLCLDFDGDQLDFDRDQRTLLDTLSCWPRYWTSTSRTDLARMQAKVLGIPHPDVPDNERNTRIQPLLARLLNALNTFCDPGPLREQPTPGQDTQVDVAAQAVRANLSSSMSTGMLLRTWQVHANLTLAHHTLGLLEPYLQTPCSLGDDPGFVGPLTALVGDKIRAEGIELVEEIRVAKAWKTIFKWLSTANPKDRPGVCRDAAVLRPTSTGAQCRAEP